MIPMDPIRIPWWIVITCHVLGRSREQRAHVEQCGRGLGGRTSDTKDNSPPERLGMAARYVSRLP